MLFTCNPAHVLPVCDVIVLAGALLFSSGTVLGNLLFALSSMPPIRRTVAMFPVMLLGRGVILGISDFPIRSKFDSSVQLQEETQYHWFVDAGRHYAVCSCVTLQQDVTVVRSCSCEQCLKVTSTVSVSRCSVIQDRLTAYWFKGKELSTAFGITITSCRIGSVANFFLTPLIASK